MKAKKPGDLILEGMVKRRMTMSELGRYCGILPSYMSKIISNQRTITPLNAIRIAKTLHYFSAYELLCVQASFLIERELNFEYGFNKSNKFTKLVSKSA